MAQRIAFDARVRVDTENQIGACMTERKVVCAPLALVRLREHLYLGGTEFRVVHAGKGKCQAPGIVVGAIVDDDDLVVRIIEADESAEGIVDAGCFTMSGNEDGDEGQNLVARRQGLGFVPRHCRIRHDQEDAPADTHQGGENCHAVKTQGGKIKPVQIDLPERLGAEHGRSKQRKEAAEAKRDPEKPGCAYTRRHQTRFLAPARRRARREPTTLGTDFHRASPQTS